MNNLNMNEDTAHPERAPIVECTQHHPGLWVPDIPAAVDFYTKKLGFKPGFAWGDPPELAGVNLGGVSIHLALGEPAPNPKGCAVYFVIGDADELYEFHRANGVEIARPPEDRPYELRDYTIRDPHGYELGFGHRIYNTGNQVKIERVGRPAASGEAPRRFAPRSGRTQAHEPDRMS
jgi:catechol 2,3-dioxygenase-like lactoylglutathione lyase family enzyme